MMYPPCGVCGAPADYLWMDPIAALDRKSQREAWVSRHKDGVDGIAAFRDMASLPMPVLWTWLCRDHDEVAGYEINLRDLDTPAKALATTLHVLRKSWAERWSWEQAMAELYGDEIHEDS